MANRVVVVGLTTFQKRSTYVIICLMSLFGGIEYAVILPTLYLHLENTWHAPQYYLGIIISAFSFSGLFAAPIMGRFYDQTHRSKILVMVASFFEFAGSLMYWFGVSPWFLITSRLVAGLGNGYFPVIIAEVSFGTAEAQRTSVVSGIMAARQFGLLLGPAFNLFLSVTDFYIGPFIVDQYSSPGIFMALLWLIILVLIPFFYHPFTSLERVSTPSPPPSHAATQNGVMSVQNGVMPVQNGNGVPTDSPHQTANGSGPPLDSQLVEDEHRSIKQAMLDITYEEYMAIYMLAFISLFNQTGIETLLTPFCDNYLGWSELNISLLYCVAGALVLIGFALVHFASKKFHDRTQIVFGSLCQVVSLIWLICWIPGFKPHIPSEYTRNTLILLPSLIVNVFGLPFLFVCHISLFSKLLTGNIQGLGHGIRRVVGGLASILGPLWAGSLLQNEYMMLGVMLGLNVLSLLLMMMSFKRLVPPNSSPQPNVSINEDADEKTRLINA